MSFPAPPPVRDHGELCSWCYPDAARTANTLCEACLFRANAEDEGCAAGGVSVEYSFHETAQTITAKVLPLRFMDAADDELLPSLREMCALTDGLMLTGPAGRGKTHQAAILVRQAIELAARNGAAKPAEFQWHSSAALFEQIRAEQRAVSVTRSTVQMLIEARVLVLDDIGAEKPSEWVRERLYEVVNARYEARRPIIVTTNLSPAQMEKRLGVRIASRLVEMCRVLELSGPQRRQPGAAA